MKNKILHVDFTQRAKDLRYLMKQELAPDRQWKRQERRIAWAIAHNYEMVNN